MSGTMARRPLPSLIVLAALLLAVACSDDMLDAECDLAVVNDSACDLVIFVDGREAFTVGAGADVTLDDIGAGRHVLEALDRAGRLVARRSLELASGEDYYWTLDDC